MKVGNGNILDVSVAGYFVCHSCKKAGSWNSFKENTELIVDLVTRKKR